MRVLWRILTCYYYTINNRYRPPVKTSPFLLLRACGPSKAPPRSRKRGSRGSVDKGACLRFGRGRLREPQEKILSNPRPARARAPAPRVFCSFRSCDRRTRVRHALIDLYLLCTTVSLNWTLWTTTAGQVTLVHSVMSGKKKTFFNGEMINEAQKVSKEWSFAWSFGAHLLRVGINFEEYALVIDGIPFKRRVAARHVSRVGDTPPVSEASLEPVSPRTVVLTCEVHTFFCLQDHFCRAVFPPRDVGELFYGPYFIISAPFQGSKKKKGTSRFVN